MMFFFSSRRRHTRWPRDWSSDVCSSDLSGCAHVGLELGSTRIKAALIDEHGTVLATGAHPWENSYIDGNWTYALDEVWQGVQARSEERRGGKEGVSGEGKTRDE